MVQTLNSSTRRLGLISAALTVSLQALYGTVLIGGLLSLKSPSDPIADPFFTLMELLILLVIPAIVLMMVAVHAWAPPDRKAFAVAAIVFASILAGLTSAVHFAILTLNRHPAFEGSAHFLSFVWPSVVYALDILAWDVFFALSALCATFVFSGSPLATTARYLLAVSGILAFIGLTGVAYGDMQLRNIGVIGYACVFPIAALIIAVIFYRSSDSLR